MQCEWLIRAQSYQQITLSFTNIDTENGTDIVTVYDYINNIPKEIGKYDGNRSAFSLKSSENQMKVLFITDDNTQRRGFNATVLFGK